jgi:hypothetical protein
MSAKTDTYVVVVCHEPYRDLVLDLGVSGVEKVSEFVTVVCQEFKKVTEGKDLPIHFAER